MDQSEGFLCAGMVDLALTPTERPAEERPSPYYLLTTAGLHFGLLLQKGGLFSKARSRNVFIARDAVARLITDHQRAVDLRSRDDDVLAFVRFTDGLPMQFVRFENDPASMHGGHRGDFTAAAQLQNFAAAFGLPLES